MLSYTFRNGKIKKEDILKVCSNEFELKTVRDTKDGIFLVNNMVSILIGKHYTHVILKDEYVNIQKIESIF